MQKKITLSLSLLASFLYVLFVEWVYEDVFIGAYAGSIFITVISVGGAFYYALSKGLEKDYAKSCACLFYIVVLLLAGCIDNQIDDLVVFDLWLNGFLSVVLAWGVYSAIKSVQYEHCEENEGDASLVHYNFFGFVEYDDRLSAIRTAYEAFVARGEFLHSDTWQRFEEHMKDLHDLVQFYRGENQYNRQYLENVITSLLVATEETLAQLETELDAIYVAQAERVLQKYGK